MMEKYFDEQTDNEESFAICALLHDLCKAQYYKQSTRNVKNEETGQWEAVPAYKTREGTNRPVYGDLGFSSYMQIKNFFSLTDEQTEAIVYSRPTDFAPDVHEVCRNFPLVTLTKMAEMAATYIS